MQMDTVFWVNLMRQFGGDEPIWDHLLFWDFHNWVSVAQSSLFRLTVTALGYS